VGTEPEFILSVAVTKFTR